MILEQQYHDELRREIQGGSFTSAGSNADQQTSTGAVQTGEEPITNIQPSVDDLSEVMMSRKRKKLLEAMKVTHFWPVYADIDMLIL